MRNLTLTALPFLLLFSATVHAEVYKCTVADNVEYRDTPCTAGAEQQEMTEISSDAQSAPPTDPVIVAAQLRQADQALSERLEKERLLRMQIAAQQAQMDQQERIAMETAELQYNNDYAVPVGGFYSPFVPFNHRHIHRHFNPPGQMMPPPQFHQRHMVNVNSFGSRAPMRAGSFAANVNF